MPPKYAVLSPIKHNGEKVMPGGTVEMSEKAAAKVSPGVLGNVVTAAPANDRVNINTADAAALAVAIDGVGDDVAAAIVTYRTEHGPFAALDDLAKVKGIGKATVQKHREGLTV